MKRCRTCGARCDKQMRYCKRCWAQVKAARESLNTQPAGARGIAEARNGEAEAVANAVGREAVPQGGSGRISANKPSVRCAPTTRRESADTHREIGGRVAGYGTQQQFAHARRRAG